MAVKTNTVTATNLTLTDSDVSTSLTKQQLDALLALLSQFTGDEAQVLKKLAQMTAVKNLVEEEDPPTYLVHSKTMNGLEKVTADPEADDEKTLYIVSEGN